MSLRPAATPVAAPVAGGSGDRLRAVLAVGHAEAARRQQYEGDIGLGGALYAARNQQMSQQRRRQEASKTPSSKPPRDTRDDIEKLTHEALWSVSLKSSKESSSFRDWYVSRATGKYWGLKEHKPINRTGVYKEWKLVVAIRPDDKTGKETATYVTLYHDGLEVFLPPTLPVEVNPKDLVDYKDFKEAVYNFVVKKMEEFGWTRIEGAEGPSWEHAYTKAKRDYVPDGERDVPALG